jgi:hypothetical protein
MARYRLEIEALPSTAGTPITRLRKLLKVMSWYRFRCRSVEEVPAAERGIARAPRSRGETANGSAGNGRSPENDLAAAKGKA